MIGQKGREGHCLQEESILRKQEKLLQLAILVGRFLEHSFEFAGKFWPSLEQRTTPIDLRHILANQIQ